MDDFLIHAPTRELCTQALEAFLDVAVDCGMLCHPKKLIPPSQVVRYCGLLLNTRGIPTLEMPVDKKERAMAMIDYVLPRRQKEWSRLALAVLAGVLESLAECTPQRIGHTHLHNLHSLIHPEGAAEGLEAYLSTTVLPGRVHTDLEWWRGHLRDGEGRVVRAQSSGALVPTFGDGSGTGTGGTLQLPGQPLRMWKGQWAPTVFSFSSNWKELTTLLLTLQHIEGAAPESVRNTTLFYFTDNSATYWICQKGSSKHPHLHEQLVRIRSLETRLQCHLWVIHVPGKVIIKEGTDGLSRGLWMTPLQDSIPRPVLMPAIFAPAPFHPALVRHYMEVQVKAYHAEEGTSLPPAFPSWEGRRWDRPWEAEECFGRTTVWFPPPEIARSIIAFLLNSHIEVPLTTSALFFIPRIMSGAWRSLSRKLMELSPVDPLNADIFPPSILPIPITVLYLPCHVRRTPNRNRLDVPPPRPGPGGTSARQTRCAGCRHPIKEGRKPTVTCQFSARGFGVKGKRLQPCGISYHLHCIRVGPPFLTRRDDGLGLTYPENSHPPVFICEACSVRAIVGRELGQAKDRGLMALERMRMLDIAHSWAPSTYESYGPFLRRIEQFQRSWGISILPAHTPRAPPSDPLIPLMWSQEAYSLRPGKDRTRKGGRVAFGTIRQLRAAVSHWEAWGLALTNPTVGYFDQGRRLVLQPCRPTDSATLTLFSKGMCSRLGTDSRPSKSLLHRHIQQLHQRLNGWYHQEMDEGGRRDFALAALCNLLLWLGWLRSSEAFSLRWEDIQLTRPRDGPQLDLPQGIGAVQLRLRPETKSNRSRRADVVLSYKSGSGLPLGTWVLRAQSACQATDRRYPLVFCHVDGTPWTSAYFREKFLYPSLHEQRAAGDAYLAPFGGGAALTLEEAFWSLGSYRNGARSWVSRKRQYGQVLQRAATKEEVYEHGRWRKDRKNEAIDKIYQQWTFADRIAITKCCM